MEPTFTKSTKPIPGLDHSYCPICQAWIIEPGEIERQEKALNRLDPQKGEGKKLNQSLSQAKTLRTKHLTHKYEFYE
jgi:hypothetical protein